MIWPTCFLGCTPSVVKAEILKQFSDPNAPLRIIFATSSFGMGVDCCDVQQVIHVGVPDDIEAYIQGTGYAGRNGESALGLLLKVIVPALKRASSGTPEGELMCRTFIAAAIM